VYADNYSGNIDDPIEDGDTLLHIACLYGHLPCVQLLLERQASLECKDEEGAIPLHDACAGGFSDIVQYILNFAANIDGCVTRMLNTVDSEGDTPLHHAARGEHLGIVDLLLKAGACAKKENTYGQVPAEMADEGTEVRKLLIQEQVEASTHTSN
jgi:ankyrin repeat protein